MDTVIILVVFFGGVFVGLALCGSLFATETKATLAENDELRKRICEMQREIDHFKADSRRTEKSCDLYQLRLTNACKLFSSAKASFEAFLDGELDAETQEYLDAKDEIDDEDDN